MTDKADPITGFLRGASFGSPEEHLYTEGAHFTLCGRTVLYQYQYMRLKKRCRRCEWEANQRAAERAEG